MTRDELIEKVARSICKFTYGDRNDDVWHTFTDEAISAIDTIFDALKEHTDEMATAVFDADEDDCIWQAMLNASPLSKGE